MTGNVATMLERNSSAHIVLFIDYKGSQCPHKIVDSVHLFDPEYWLLISK